MQLSKIQPKIKPLNEYIYTHTHVCMYLGLSNKMGGFEFGIIWLGI